MNKLVKILIVFFINFIIFGILFFINDYFTYKFYVNLYEKKQNPALYQINDFSYKTFVPSYITDLKNFFDGNDNSFSGRKPDGLEYKNKTPVILFGCSFAYGQYLNYNQTFSYKLAEILKRPVYNRAIIGGSFQHMYFQAVDYGNKDLFNDIKDTDTVIYIMINDHYRRSMLYYFNVLDTYILPHYSYKNGSFRMTRNKFIKFIQSTYTVKNLNHIYADKFVLNPKRSDILTEQAVNYFEATRNKLEEHYGKKIKFYVILYDTWDIPHNKLLTEKLKNKGFIVLSTRELTDKDLNSPKYMMQDSIHPTEEAWNLLTPLIAKKIKEQK